MALLPDGDSTTEGFYGPSFLWSVMPVPFGADVVRRALDWRGNVSNEARNKLQQAITNTFTVKGYRRAGLAPTSFLLDQVLEGVRFRDDVAAAVLQVWLDSQGEAMDQVFRRLDSLGIPTRGSDLTDYDFRFRADDDWWEDAAARFFEDHPGDWEDCQDEEILLFTLATGVIVGGLDVGEDLEDHEDFEDLSLPLILTAAYVSLEELPAHNPEWEEAIPSFIASLLELTESKQQERCLGEALDALLAEIRSAYQELLVFFQWDSPNWASANIASHLDLETVETFAKDLNSLLSRYAPVHERGQTAAEELGRSKQRTDLLPAILETGGKLEDAMDSDDDDSEARPALLPHPGPEGDGARNALPDVVGDSPAPPPPEALPEPAAGDTDPPAPEGFTEVPPCDIDDYLLLHLEVAELQQENDDLERELKSLEKALFESRSKEESYWYAQASQEDGSPQTVPDITDVNAAVRLARERFDGQLMFRLNSDSSVEGNQFKWPEKIWNALEWLATTYYEARTGKTQNSDLDASCRLASGMWYKTSQHETTITNYRKSYTTKVDGRTIWLQEHIGKGTSFDPRRTIRIGFDWDRDLRQVVIGYIGQHQRTSST